MILAALLLAAAGLLADAPAPLTRVAAWDGGAGAPGGSTLVRLAGTFNNWATSDDRYLVKKVAGDRYELETFWPCGTYEFKFVFDGSWSRHWGVDTNGRLEQPGTNIPLVVQQSHSYRLWLDTAKREWGLARCAPRRPHAVLVVHGGDGLTAWLDATASLARPGRPLTTWQWEVKARGGGAGPASGQSQLITVDTTQRGTPQRPFLEVPAAGPYEIGLLIGDGEMEDTVRIFRELGRRSGADATQAGHVVDYEPKRDARLPADLFIERVEVVGDFSGWQAGRHPLTSDLDGRRWRIALDLPDGLYHYKLLVNGAIALEDLAADPALREPDCRGAYNSGFRIGPDGRALGPARFDDICAEALAHSPDDAAYFTPISKKLVRVTVRCLSDDVQSVELAEGSDRQEQKRTPLRKSASRDGFDYWSTVIETPTTGFRYHFILTDGPEIRLMDATGAHRMKSPPTAREEIRPFEALAAPAFETPDWAKRVVWYQIFPERFCNGEPANDPPQTVPWRHAWFKPFVGRTPDGSGGFSESGDFYSYIYDRRYGGDIQGIRAKLPYLRRLGISALYLNPIFSAPSLHKYDAADYRHIDDHLAVKDSVKKLRGETEDPSTWKWSESDRLFLDFLKEAHRQGFRVILDGVFNHVGCGFWAFKDVLAHGEKSRYAGWFDVTSWKPFHYKAWDGDDGALPRLKHDDALGLAEPVREHIFAVTRRWMDPDGDGDPSDGIDGWRLDVAGDINENFWKDWRKLVKSINPDAYLVGELWEESRAWLDGRTFDAVMNYPFARLCQQFFVNRRRSLKPSIFARRLEEMLGWYAPQVNLVLQNLLDSHDTDRVASMFLNPDLEYDKANRLQDSNPKYNAGRPTAECYEKLRGLVTFQMTFPGAPMIYYGAEVGMYGADDPSCRKPMLWEELLPYDDPDERIHRELFEHYRRMIAIRNAYPVLQLGSFETLASNDRLGVFAFSRSLGRESVVVAINKSGRGHRLNVPVPWADGSRVVRVDDPEAFELIEPAEDEPTARPVLRRNTAHRSKLKVEGGHLRGAVLPARRGAVFVSE